MTKSLKKVLQAGGKAGGCWLELFSPLAAEIIGQAGYDCVMIDLEHGQGSVMDAIVVMQALKGSGTEALLRVPANDPVWIKRVLDAGVAGVMIPTVDSVAEAEAAVAACRYPPKGRRGMAAPIARAADYGAVWQDYVARIDSDLLVICQIESAAAVDNVAEIAAVEGVDMLFVGPMDLSGSLGYFGEPDHPEVLKRIAEVEAAGKAAGKLLGAIATPARSLGDLYGAGYDLIVADADCLLLRDGARAGAAALKAAAGR